MAGRSIPKALKVALSRLKGISVYCAEDLYVFAQLMLKVADARAVKIGSNAVCRPTVKDLGKRFAEFSSRTSPDYELVSAVLAKHGLPTGAMLDFDERIEDTRPTGQTGSKTEQTLYSSKAGFWPISILTPGFMVSRRLKRTCSTPSSKYRID